MTTRKHTVVVGFFAGLVGTATMTTGYRAEHLVRRKVTGPLDYDDGPVPAEAAARVLDWSNPSPGAERVLGFLVHWGYGSAVGLGTIPLLRRLGPKRAIAAFWAAITVMAGVLFPVLGRTPPPWRWKRDVLATSLLQHLLYAAAVVGTLEALHPDHGRR